MGFEVREGEVREWKGARVRIGKGIYLEILLNYLATPMGSEGTSEGRRGSSTTGSSTAD